MANQPLNTRAEARGEGRGGGGEANTEATVAANGGHKHNGVRGGRALASALGGCKGRGEVCVCVCSEG